MTRITLESVYKKFGDTVAVDNLSLEIAEGEFFSLVGPSGCGKTTTMRMIAGLETPSDGSIRVGDNLVFDAKTGLNKPPASRGIGMVFQSYALWPHMTVNQNVSFGLEVRGIRGKVAETKVRDTLEQLQIADYADRYPGELSGGQQQRVALARELAVDAKILQMDEPLSNLDARLRMEMRVELKRLHAESGATFIYVTHDQMEALTLSTRMAVINGGVIQQVGTPREIYEKPTNLFVAEFLSLSRLNTIPGVISNNRLNVAGCDFSLPEKTSVHEGQKILVGLRPDELELAENGEIPCTVLQSFVAGSTTLTTLETHGGVTLNVVEPFRRILWPKQKVSVRCSVEKMLIFDQESERRIETMF